MSAKETNIIPIANICTALTFSKLYFLDNAKEREIFEKPVKMKYNKNGNKGMRSLLSLPGKIINNDMLNRIYKI